MCHDVALVRVLLMLLSDILVPDVFSPDVLRAPRLPLRVRPAGAARWSWRAPGSLARPGAAAGRAAIGTPLRLRMGGRHVPDKRAAASSRFNQYAIM